VRVLAIETATEEVGVGLGVDGTLAASVAVRSGHRHTEALHPAVEAVLREGGLRPADLDAIAVDVGPGLFTGLRAGIAAAKALGFALGVRLVPVTSTAVLAHAAACAEAAVVPVVDLRRRSLAFSLPGEEDEPRLGPLEDLVAALRELGDVVLVGDGALRRREELAAALAARRGSLAFAGRELAAPPVVALAELGEHRATQGALVDPAAVVPCYLREPDARANFATRAGASV